MMAEHRGGAEKPNHDSDALRSMRTRSHHLLHVFMHHLDGGRPQGCRHGGGGWGAPFPSQRASSATSGGPLLHLGTLSPGLAMHSSLHREIKTLV